MKLRVATYNIHKGVTGIRGRPRIHDVKVALNSIDADIVFLQEVQDRNEMLRHHANYPAARQLDYLAGGGYDHLAYGMNAVYPHGHHGNAILSRHTIGRFANHDISDHALERRGMLHAVSRVLPPRGRRVREVHLICVHFGLIKRSRLRQASQLADFVDQEIPEGAPLIIAGDFNDWQRRVDELLRGRLDVKEVSFSDLGANGSPWAAHRSVLDRVLPWRKSRDDAKSVSRTFPSFAPWLTLDRIYVRGFSVRGIEVPKGLAWAKRSDHAPLIADLELR